MNKNITRAFPSYPTMDKNMSFKMGLIGMGMLLVFGFMAMLDIERSNSTTHKHSIHEQKSKE